MMVFFMPSVSIPTTSMPEPPTLPLEAALCAPDSLENTLSTATFCVRMASSSGLVSDSLMAAPSATMLAAVLVPM